VARQLAVVAVFVLSGCRIAMVGDSITEGSCSSEPCTGWVELTQRALPDTEIVNAGCGATTTASWIQHPPEPLVGLQCLRSFFVDAAGNVWADALGQLWAPLAGYRATFVLLGNNDARFTGFLTDATPIEPWEYRANLEVLIDELLEGSTIVVLMTPTSRPSTTLPTTAMRLDAYAEEIEDLCRRHRRVRCGPDLRHELDSDLHYEADDGVHPNQLGHAAIADAVTSWIDANLDPPTRRGPGDRRPPRPHWRLAGAASSALAER
jgi:lysophospholipase L1-like esterase